MSKKRIEDDAYMPDSFAGVAQWVERKLREDIGREFYPENSFLPSQRILSEQLGVPRSAIRVALEKLMQSGLVDACRGRGTRVLPKGERKVQQTIAYIHSPLRSWSGLEPHHIRDGVLRRSQQLGCNCVEISVYDSDGMPSMHGETARPVSIKELPEVLKEYSAYIFHEASSIMTRFIVELVDDNKPVVVANLETELNVSATCVDHFAIGKKAVETVASFGHRHIAYVGKFPEQVFYGKYLAGFREGIKVANLEIDEANIALCKNIDLLDAYRATLLLLKRSDAPTAIVAARDSLAAGVCEAIREVGLEVGRDISVVGFDDVSWGGANPFLTTFHEPCTEMGAVAVDMLMARISNSNLPIEQHLLDVSLVLRRSVGPLLVL